MSPCRLARRPLIATGDSEVRGWCGMKEIKVIFSDDSTGIVHDSKLDSLILAGKIKAFLRSDGWVRIGTDRIREIRFHGAGRGKKEEKKPPA